MAYNDTILRFQNGLTVGNKGAVRPPSTYSVSTGDIDIDSQRSMSGYMNRNRVRGGADAVYTVKVSWVRLTWEELNKLIEAGEDASFSLTFLDPKSHGLTTKTVYRDANMEYTLNKIYTDEEAYWSTTMTFIEY